MSYSGEMRTFSVSWWHPSTALAGTILFASMVPGLIILGRYERPIDFVAGLLLLPVPLYGCFLAGRNFLLLLIEPHSIVVSEEGIEGRPLSGPPVAMAWREVITVEAVEASKQRFARAEETVRLRAAHGRLLVVDSRIGGFVRWGPHRTAPAAPDRDAYAPSLPRPGRWRQGSSVHAGPTIPAIGSRYLIP